MFPPHGTKKPFWGVLAHGLKYTCKRRAAAVRKQKHLDITETLNEAEIPTFTITKNVVACLQ